MLRRSAPLVLAVGLLAACGGDAVAPSTTVATANTVGGVGRLPSTIPEVTFAEGVADGFVLPALEGVAIGEEVAGNRVLMIGDSIFAGLSPRHGDQACRQLVPLGWQVAVEAESGRFAEFGVRVANRRGGEGWDAVVVFLGSNYDGGKRRYEADMTTILERFADVPVVLVTSTAFRSAQNEVNGVVRALAEQRPNVRVIEWEEISRTRGLLSPDGLHPSADGQVVLAAAVAQVLGAAPGGEGRCLDSLFTDDSVNPEAPRTGGSSSGSATSSASTSEEPGDGDDTDITDDSVTDDSVSEDGTTDETGPDTTDTTDTSTAPDTTTAPGTTVTPDGMSPPTTAAPVTSTAPATSAAPAPATTSAP